MPEGDDVDSSDWAARFFAKHIPSTTAIDYFRTTWLKPYLDDPLYITIPTFSRILKETGEDFFFARTIATDKTIPHQVSLQLRDFASPPETILNPSSPETASIGHNYNDFKPTPAPTKPDTVFLLSLARPGLDGHPGVIHGGMACAILDEMMGLTVMLHHQAQRLSGPRDSLFTASLHVTYKAPVPTPSDVLVKSWMVARQGRKSYTIGQITDINGKVLTEGKGMWILAKGQKL